MNYTPLARQFVKGLVNRTKGTEFESLQLHILSQWIYESDHFRSKLAVAFNNAGGMQYRKGYPGPHAKALYKDWQGKETWHFLLTNADRYCDLYLWFIGRAHYKAVDNIPNTGHPGDFIIELAHDGYVTDMAKPITDVSELAQALRSVGLPQFAEQLELMPETELTYKASIPWNYLHRIQSIANRPETTELLRHEWTDKVVSMMGAKNTIEHEDEEAPEWMGLYVDGEE